MADLTTYGDEFKRNASSYGSMAEMSSAAGAPIGLTKPVTGQIGDLAKQMVEAAHMLAEAREQHQRAAVQRQKAEAGFASVSEALLRAIHEHREGTPENVPYQP